MGGESVDDRLNNLQSRFTACRKRFSLGRGKNTSSKRTRSERTTQLKTEVERSTHAEEEQRISSMQAEKPVDEKEKEKQEPRKQETGKADPVQKSPVKPEVVELVDTDTNRSKEKLHDFVEMFYPVLRDIPDWVSGSYLEFKDDRIRLCTKCRSACEWVFFDVQGENRQELCAHCFKDAGVEDEYQIYLREGVTEYLSGLDGAAVKIMALSNSSK